MAHQNLALWQQLMKVSILVSDHAWNRCPSIINMCTTIGPSSSSSSQPNLDFPSSDTGELLRRVKTLRSWVESTNIKCCRQSQTPTHLSTLGHVVLSQAICISSDLAGSSIFCGSNIVLQWTVHSVRPVLHLPLSLLADMFLASLCLHHSKFGVRCLRRQMHKASSTTIWNRWLRWASS